MALRIFFGNVPSTPTPVSGTAGITLPHLTAQATGIEEPRGTSGITLPFLSLQGAGAAAANPVTGTGGISLPRLSLQADGITPLPPAPLTPAPPTPHPSQRIGSPRRLRPFKQGDLTPPLPGALSAGAEIPRHSTHPTQRLGSPRRFRGFRQGEVAAQIPESPIPETSSVLDGMRIDVYNNAGTMKLGDGPITDITSHGHSFVIDQISTGTAALPATAPNVDAIIGLCQLWFYKPGEGYIFKGFAENRDTSDAVLTVSMMGIEEVLWRTPMPPDTKFVEASPTVVLQTVLGIVGHGWTAGEVGTSFATYTGDVSFRNGWQVLLDAGKVFGFHVRADQAHMEIDFAPLGDDCGLTLLQPDAFSPALQSNRAVATITNAKTSKTNMQLVNRIGAQGNGTGYGAITMEAANKQNNLILDGSFDRPLYQSISGVFTNPQFFGYGTSIPQWHGYLGYGINGDRQATNDRLTVEYGSDGAHSGAYYLKATLLDAAPLTEDWGAFYFRGYRLTADPMWGESLGRTFHAEGWVRISGPGGVSSVADAEFLCAYGPWGPIAASQTRTLTSGEWTFFEVDWTCDVSGADWPIPYVRQASGTLGNEIHFDDVKVIDRSFGEFDVQLSTGAEGRKLTYIEDAASIADIGIRAQYLNIRNNSPLEASWEGYVRSANGMVDVVSQIIARSNEEIISLTGEVVNLFSTQFQLGDKMRAIYFNEPDAVDIDMPLWVLGYSRTLDSSGSNWQLNFSSIDLLRMDSEAVTAGNITSLTSLSNDLGVSNIELTVAPPARKIKQGTVLDTGLDWLEVAADYRDVTSLRSVSLEIHKTSKGYAAYQVQIFTPEGSWELYGPNSGCYLGLSAPITSASNPIQNANPLTLINTLITEVDASTAYPQYKSGIDTLLGGAITQYNASQPNAAITTLLQLAQSLITWGLNPNGTGITANDSANWRNQLGVISATIGAQSAIATTTPTSVTPDSITIDVTQYFQRWPTPVPWYDAGNGDIGIHGPVVRINQVGGAGDSTVEVKLKSSCYTLSLLPSPLALPENLCTDDPSINPSGNPGGTQGYSIPISLRTTGFGFGRSGSDPNLSGYLNFDPYSGTEQSGLVTLPPAGTVILVLRYHEGHEPTITDDQGSTWRKACEVTRAVSAVTGYSYYNPDIDTFRLTDNLVGWTTAIFYAYGIAVNDVLNITLSGSTEVGFGFATPVTYAVGLGVLCFWGLTTTGDPLAATFTASPSPIPGHRADQTYWDDSGGLSITTPQDNCLVVYFNDSARGDLAGISIGDTGSLYPHPQGTEQVFTWFGAMRNGADGFITSPPNYVAIGQYAVVEKAGPLVINWEPDGSTYSGGFEWANNHEIGNGFIVAAAFKGGP